MLVVLILLLVSMAFTEPCDGPDPQRISSKDKKVNDILFTNDNLSFTLNKLYNKIPHNLYDNGNIVKENFAAVAGFYVNFVHFFRLRRRDYEQAYKAALLSLDTQSVNPVEEATPLRGLVDFLRVVVSKRVADVQRLCRNKASKKKCRKDLVAADKEQEHRCPGYLAHAAFHDRLLDNYDEDRELLDKLVDTQFYSREQVRSFLVENKLKYKNTLVRLADLIYDLAVTSFACTSVTGQDLLF